MRRDVSTFAGIALALLAGGLFTAVEVAAADTAGGNETAQAEDTCPPSIMHDAVTHGAPGRPVHIEAKVVDRSGVKVVVLFYKKPTEKAYHSMRMIPRRHGRYTAWIPPAEDGATKAEYYIEAVDMAGNSSASEARAVTPIVVHFDGEGAASKGVGFPLWAFAGVLASLGAAVTALTLWRRRKRRTQADNRFWNMTLAPLLYLPPQEFTARLTELSRRQLVHPVRGPTRFPRTVILKKFVVMKQVLGQDASSVA